LGVILKSRFKVTAAPSAIVYDFVSSPNHLATSVIVVDVDTASPTLIRDLHRVFPTIRTVAIGKDAVALAQAARAGASAVLNKPASAQLVAVVVKQLLQVS